MYSIIGIPSLLVAISAALSCSNDGASTKRIAVVGEGVIGLSTALAIKEMDPNIEVHIFHDRPFTQTLSHGIAGLFRIDNSKPIIRKYGNDTFVRLAQLWRMHGGLSGVQLVSGHILCEDKKTLLSQQESFGDIVYNFRFLSDREIQSQFVLDENDKSEAIHYTAFTSEGAKYCPWMKKELISKGVQFHKQKINSLDDLADSDFPIVINCAGIYGGQLAGDDDTVYPIRGVLLKVDAPWQKHFLYRNFSTFTIPTINAVYVGTVKEEGKDGMAMTADEIEYIWSNYLRLQPAFKNVKILDHFIGLRPGRSEVRVEIQERTTQRGNNYKAVHNYGHGGSGFTIGWGTALHAASLALDRPVHDYTDLATFIESDISSTYVQDIKSIPLSSVLPIKL